MPSKGSPSFASPSVAYSLSIAIFSGFTTLAIESAIDNAADGFSLTGAFDPANADLEARTKPFGYQKAEVKIDGELIISGIVGTPSFDEKPDENTFTLEGRSPAGQIIDCSIDGSMGYEFTGLKLSQIAKKLCAPFGITVQVGLDTVESRTVIKERTSTKTIHQGRDSVGKGQSDTLTITTTTRETVIENTLKEAKARPGQKVFDFLNELANRKKILLTSATNGDLVLRQPAGTGKPTASIVSGVAPYMGGSSSFNGDEYYSDFKVLHQESGNPSIIGTCKDPRIKVYRPLVDSSIESESHDVTSPAKWVRAHSLAKAISVSIQVSGWRNAEGMIWRKADLVTLKAPRLKIKNEYTFLIAGVSLRLTPTEGKTTTLRLVLPAAYTGELPGGYPWD